MWYGPEWNDPEFPGYPPGFEWIYGVIVLTVLVAGIWFLGGYSPTQPNHGDVILNICATATHNDKDFDDCTARAVTALCPLPDEETHWENCVKENLK